ncbi:MAG: Fic family protein [Clostridia bacterium]
MIFDEVSDNFNNVCLKRKEFILENFIENVSENSVLIERIYKLKDPKYYELAEKNIQENFRWLINLAKDRSHILNLKDIKDINYNVLKNITIGGILRNIEVRLSSSEYLPPAPEEAYYQMKSFEENLKINKTKMKPLEYACWAHCEFVRIHPFEDGNGRTARAIMNYNIIQAGCIPVIIKYKTRNEYIKANNIYFETGDLKPFILFIQKLLKKQATVLNLI